MITCIDCFYEDLKYEAMEQEEEASIDPAITERALANFANPEIEWNLDASSEENNDNNNA